MIRLSRRLNILFKVCLVVFLFPLLCSVNNLFAETVATEDWQISADKLLRFEDPTSIVAEGSVVMVKRKKLPPKRVAPQKDGNNWAALLEEKEEIKPELTPEILEKDQAPRYINKIIIKADWVSYDVERSSIRLRGNIDIDTGEERLLADKGTVNLSKATGSFGKAILVKNDNKLHLEGKSIEKTGENTYHIVDGWVITCKAQKGETPPWSFAGKDTTITEGGYAFIKHATFRIKNVPIFYTPFIIVPVKNTRQTGFLMPELSYSSHGGAGFNLPFFVNISDSTDLTLYPEMYSNRGVMPGVEYRYMQSKSNKGFLMLNYLHDRLTDPQETEYYEDTGYTHTNQDRYWIRGKLDHDLGADLLVRLDLDITSDRDYLNEFISGSTGFDNSYDRFFDVFGRGFQNQTEDQRNNSLKILKFWKNMSLEGNFMAINDNRVDQTSPTPLWKLPSLDFSGILPFNNMIGDTDLSFEWDADYVNYWREDGIGAQRIDVHPRLSTPLSLGPYLEARAETGVRGTYYSVEAYGDEVWENDDTPNRFLFDFETEVATTLVKNFGFNADKGTSWSHEVRPYISYEYISDDDQEDLPDLDSVDRIADLNQITYGVNNFFNVFGNSNEGNNSSRDYAYFKIWQSYDLGSNSSDNPFLPVHLEVYLRPNKNLSLYYKTAVDVYGAGVTFYNLEGAYKNSRGDKINLDYRYDEDIDIHQFNAVLKAKLWEKFSAAYSIEHSLSESQIIEQNFSIFYQPSCWSVELRSEYTPGDTKFMVVFNLANIGTPLGVGVPQI